MHPGIKSWKNLLFYAFNAFSIPLLVRTLFAPWQMDRAKGDKLDLLERVVFAVFARFLGIVSRLFLIFFGLLFCFLIFISFPIFFFFPVKISLKSLEKLGSFGAELSYGNTFYLNKHSRELFLPRAFNLYGKEKSLRMIERGLLKDTNHNVLLVGEAGVGKDTIVRHLGLLGKSGLTYPGILHKRVVKLDIEGLSLDEFEYCLREADQAGNIILVIKNIHLYESVFERLMPYLEKRHLGVVGITDFAGYDMVLKRHGEFLEQFEKVEVLPMNKENTLLSLRNHCLLNNVKHEDGALEKIVELADKYIGNQAEPTRSLLVLEELRALKKKISVQDVEEIVSDKTNVPVGVMSKNEKEILLNLEEIMKTKVIGQDKAVHQVVGALKRLRAGIGDKGKPAGSFLFLGPTGVGKTYTAKVLAKSYFGRESAMIRFDMSEYFQKDGVEVFAERLAAVVEEYPMSLVFLDELEKADRAVQHLLLQVLDEGKLTRISGRVASFKESIIIATSNAGARDIMQDPDISEDYLINLLVKNGVFAPEFLNRFSSVVMFNPLSKENMRNIARILLSDLANKILEEKGIKIKYKEETIEGVVEEGFAPEFGARSLRRAIEKLIESPLADHIIKGDIEGGIVI